MNNVNKLREILFDQIEKLTKGTGDIKIAAEISNTAGKIISASSAQIAYYHLRKEKPEIYFLHSSDTDKENIAGKTNSSGVFE